VDKRGLYGGDEFIMKATGHELKGLMEYMDCRVAGLHFPLAVLVDYRGYRLIAEAILPVGRDTLVYGSADGGTNIHADHPHMNARMKTAAKILNLKGARGVCCVVACIATRGSRWIQCAQAIRCGTGTERRRR
jgi:hypothetical protein